MSFLNDIVVLPVTDIQVAEWLKELACQGIIRKRVIDKMGEVFKPVELRDKTCAWLCMNAKDFYVIRKYVPDMLDMFNDAETMKTGKMGLYCGAVVVVSRKFDKPEGFAEDELPEGVLESVN